MASTGWYRALTLSERVRHLRLAVPTTHDLQDDAQNASQRLAPWRAQPPFDQEGWFARRLMLEGLDEATFCRLLSETDDVVRSRCPSEPVWCQRLASALSSGAVGTPIPV